jgi:hypothetical protein
MDFFMLGCIGDSGQCYKVGEEIIQKGCIKAVCKPGGFLEETQFGKKKK